MSTWLMSWLGALPLRWIVSSLMAAGLFWVGHRLGQQGVQLAWDAERMQQQTAALAQSLQVAQVQTQQEQINQRISTDHDTRKNQLQHLWRPQKPPILSTSPVSAPPGGNDQRTDAERLRKPASSTDSSSTLPTYAEPAIGVDAAASHAVPDSASAQIPVSCEQLASVCDEVRMHEIMDTWKPHTVYHAAAYKHVPLVEHNPAEGVRNNVWGNPQLTGSMAQPSGETCFLTRCLIFV